MSTPAGRVPSPWDRIELAEGDITRIECDAIVNAANSSLLGGGGVDGAIHRAAGPGMLAECRALGGCATGQAKITRGHGLPARYVIHTVGPVYQDGLRGEPELLKSCYVASLRLAIENELRSIAFPAISCGAYGYPLDAAARIAIGETAQFISGQEGIERVTFVLYGREAYTAYGLARRELL